jgi:hypothetical protein
MLNYNNIYKETLSDFLMLKRLIGGKKSMARIFATFLGVFSLLIVAGLVLANTHVSTVELQPEWSVPDATNNYDVEICNTNTDPDGDAIDEIRIMQNPNYENLTCKTKADWTLIPVSDFPDPELGLVDICWYFTDDAHAIPEDECRTFEFDADAPKEDPGECFLTWKFETRDIADYWMWIYDTTNIDSEPPVTTKSFIGPQKIEKGVEWIDGVTLVNLSAVDMSEECGIGVDKTYYKNKLMEDLVEEHGLPLDPEAPCWDESICRDLAGMADHIGSFDIYTEPFPKEGQSCHVLWYYSVDELGNEENVSTNCFFVDTTPPEVHKDNGNAIFDYNETMFKTKDNPRGEFHWITPDMPITFTCTDPEPHPSGDEEICYRVSYDYPSWGYITDGYCDTETITKEGYGGEWCCTDASPEPDSPFDFYFNKDEDSFHNLEYFCRDAVEKFSDIHIQYYKVDSVAPKISKTMIGDDHLGYDASGALSEEACPPRPGKGDVCYVADNGDNGVNISVKDGGDVCAVDDMSCSYELWWTAPTGEEVMVASDEFSSQAEVIFTEDSTHTLIVNCEDALGNQMIEDVEIFLVDSTPPVTEKWFEPDAYVVNGIEWIDTVHEVVLNATDEKVGVNETWYMNILAEDAVRELQLRVDPDMPCLEPEFCEIVRTKVKNNLDHPYFVGKWNLYNGSFKKPEESCHVLVYNSIDKLGNEEELQVNCFFVDKTRPSARADTKEIFVTGG